MITIEQMQYILELSKTHSFHKTAENLYISQPAVSKAIKKAEDELLVKLFERSSQGVYLTRQGIELVKIIDNLLGQFNKLYLTADKFAYYQKGYNIKTIQIYSHNAISNYVLPQIMADMYSYIKDLDMRVIETSPGDSLDKIKLDKTGLGIGVFEDDDFLNLDSFFCATKLCRAEPYLVVNKEMFPLNCNLGEKISLEKIAEYPLAINQFTPPLSGFLLEQMISSGNDPQVILKYSTASIFRKYITEGLACGIVMKLGNFFTFPTPIENIIYVPIENEYKFQLCLYAHKEFPEELYLLFYHLLRKLIFGN